MQADCQIVRGRKIAGSLRIPVSLLHPTNAGIDRQWTGFILSIYEVASGHAGDRFAFHGLFLSNMSDIAWPKVMIPSQARQVVDGRTGELIQDVDAWLEEIVASED